MNKAYLAVVLAASFCQFLCLFALSLFAINPGWGSVFLACVTLMVGIIGVHRSSVVDLVFATFVNWVVALQLLSLLVWPEFVAYEDAMFYVAHVSESSARGALWALSALCVGWLTVTLVDIQRADFAASIRSPIDTSFVFPVLIWLYFSTLVIGVLATIFGVGIAGAEHHFPFEGALYYLFPADYLAIALACGLGCGIKGFDRHRALIVIGLALYLIVKLACGWKSPILSVSLAYAVGLFYGGGSARLLRFLPVLIAVALAYVLIVKPAANMVRTGSADDSDGLTTPMVIGMLNPFASRLTEGTLFSAAAIESGAMWRAGVEPTALGMDFVNRLVPGSVWDVRSIDRVFTEDILGQPAEVPSAFAPGLVGTAEMLGGGLAAFWYGFGMRAAFFLLLGSATFTRDGVLRAFVFGSVAVSTVSLTIDGYFGGIEKLGIVGIVLLMGLLMVKATREFARALGSAPRASA